MELMAVLQATEVIAVIWITPALLAGFLRMHLRRPQSPRVRLLLWVAYLVWWPLWLHYWVRETTRVDHPPDAADTAFLVGMWLIPALGALLMATAEVQRMREDRRRGFRVIVDAK